MGGGHKEQKTKKTSTLCHLLLLLEKNRAGRERFSILLDRRPRIFERLGSLGTNKQYEGAVLAASMLCFAWLTRTSAQISSLGNMSISCVLERFFGRWWAAQSVLVLHVALSLPLRGWCRCCRCRCRSCCCCCRYTRGGMFLAGASWRAGPSGGFFAGLVSTYVCVSCVMRMLVLRVVV